MIMIRINLTISIRNFYGAINRKLNSTWFKHKRAIYWLSFQTTSELVVPHIRLIQHFHFVIKRFTFSVLTLCYSSVSLTLRLASVLAVGQLPSQWGLHIPHACLGRERMSIQWHAGVGLYHLARVSHAPLVQILHLMTSRW